MGFDSVNLKLNLTPLQSLKAYFGFEVAQRYTQVWQARKEEWKTVGVTMD